MPRNLITIFLFLSLLAVAPLAALMGSAHAEHAPTHSDCITLPHPILSDIPFTITATCENLMPDSRISDGVISDSRISDGDAAPPVFHLNNTEHPAQKTDKGWQATVTLPEADTYLLKIKSGDTITEQLVITTISGYWSLLPAFLTIVTSLLSRQVIPALFLGIWSGAWIIRGFSLEGIWLSLLDVVDTYALRAYVPADGDTSHIAIAIFTLLTGGMIGIISRNGGMGGIVYRITRFAHTPRQGQLSATFLGTLMFFDDYASALVVGNTMRPLIDKLRVSREKLSYLVDTTAAPVACIALVTTWIGFQLSLISSTLPAMGPVPFSAYELMMHAILYCFYPILTVLFAFAISFMGRDFGPMYEAERTARKQVADPALSRYTSHNVNVRSGHAYLAVVPVLMLVFATLSGILATGTGSTLQEIFGSSDPLKAMVWASLLSLLTACVLSVTSRQMSMQDTMDAMHKGFHPMLLAIIILTFAWAIAEVNTVLHTAEFITTLLGRQVDPTLLPLLVFTIACIISFATGSSWGTMGILIPLVLPLAWTVMQHHGIQDPAHMAIFYATLGAVFSGSAWGDHCSPISDTTILSSISSSCDHMAHVRTQMPYAITAGIITVVTAIIPTAHGLPWWGGLLAGAIVTVVTIRIFGRTIPDYV